MEKLKTLQDHNKAAAIRHPDYTQPTKNGIACPRCENELVDLNPGMILMSSPPKADVFCTECSYRGYRVV